MKEEKFKLFSSITMLLLMAAAVVITIMTISSTKKAEAEAKAELAKIEDEKLEYRAAYESKIEPIVADSTFSRNLIKNQPEELVLYAHITDVLFGTNFCQGYDKEQFLAKVQKDPVLMDTVSSEYLEYLDNKYGNR